MNVLKDTIKSLLFIVPVATLGVGAWFYFSHNLVRTYRVEVAFRDVKGLARQSIVRMRGVTIGEVETVRLETGSPDGTLPHPIVTLRIEEKYLIPAESRFRIVSGVLITNPQIEIEPVASTGYISMTKVERKQGLESGGPLEALSPELSKMVTHINDSFVELKSKFETTAKKLDRLLDETTQLVRTSNETVGGVKTLVTDPKKQRQLANILTNLEKASDNGRIASAKLTQRLDEVLDSGKGTLSKLEAKVLTLLDNLGTTLEDADLVVKKLTEQVTDPRLQQSLQETVELARTTLARFNQIASDLHQFTGDPQFQSDFKQTIANLKNATAQGEEAVGKVNKLLGSVVGPDGKTPSVKLPEANLLANVSERIDPSRLRVDLEARIATGRNALVNLGAYDLGGNTGLILQGGNRLRNGDWLLRYGLYDSRIGAGLEWMPSPGTGIRADLYNTNRPQLDLRALYRVNKNASLWLGVDGVFRRPAPLIGIQITR